MRLGHGEGTCWRRESRESPKHRKLVKYRGKVMGSANEAFKTFSVLMEKMSRPSADTPT